MDVYGFTVLVFVTFCPFSDSVSITFSDNVRKSVFTRSNGVQPSSSYEGALFLGESYERILTSLEYFKNGVNVDFRYNETETATSGSVSVPGCPKSVEGRPWIYYGSPRRCYLVGFKGPCSYGKKLFQVQNSNVGLCNCDCFANKELNKPGDDSEIDNELINGRGAHRRLMRRLQYPYHPVQMNWAWLPSHFFPFEHRRPQPVTSTSAPSVPTPQIKFHMKAQQESPEDDDLIVGNRILNRDSHQDSILRYDSCYSPSFRRQVLYDSEREECYPVLEQGPCPDKDHWLIRNTLTMGLECEKRKCGALTGYEHIANFGGAFSYFDYRRQECLTEQYGSLRETSYSHSGLVVRSSLCRSAGMKYSQLLKTCIRDLSSTLDFKAIG